MGAWEGTGVSELVRVKKEKAEKPSGCDGGSSFPFTSIFFCTK